MEKVYAVISIGETGDYPSCQSVQTWALKQPLFNISYEVVSLVHNPMI